MTHVDVIHLYTRVCNGVDAKLFYVGCIQGVKILSKENRGASHEVKESETTRRFKKHWHQ